MTDERILTPDDRFVAIRELGGGRYRAFLAAGYREWYSPTGPYRTPYLLQKVIRGDVGQRQFSIDVWAWDFSTDAAEGKIPTPFMIEAWALFQLPCGGIFNVQFLDDCRWGPGEIEPFFGHVYEVLGCVPYDDGE